MLLPVANVCGPTFRVFALESCRPGCYHAAIVRKLHSYNRVTSSSATLARRVAKLRLAAALAIVLAGCGSTPTPAPAGVPATATTLPPTATETATRIPTLAPTNTPSATATPSATPTSTATATPLPPTPTRTPTTRPPTPTRIPPTPVPPAVMTVIGNRSWQDSGVAITQGQKVSLRASGEWTGQMEFVSKETFIVRWKGPEGGFAVDPARASLFLLPSVLGGALVGKIGPDGAPFLVGASLDLTASVSGNLFLAMNDDQGMLKDNQGSVQVSISVGP